MRREDFHFELPPELIAQRPAPQRSASRLLALDGTSGVYRDLAFRDLPQLLVPGDLLVFNDTRVIPARVFGQKSSGGRIELLLERVLSPRTALVHARSSKPLRREVSVALPGGITACLLGREGALLRLEFSGDVLAFFETFGQMPLPPYITRPPEAADRDRYQTIYARAPGAVAAPTAGLHFDAAAFAALAARGIAHTFVTLHVGAGTFQPLRDEDIDAHVMHAETVSVPESACAAIAAARAAGGRIHGGAQPRDRGLGRAPRALPRRHENLHHARTSIRRGRRDRHQFSSAGIDVVDALRGVRRARTLARGLPARNCGAVSIFQLR
jgi:S-adenosylmethionine:tRNA ribosyltransferase-isomerase